VSAAQQLTRQGANVLVVAAGTNDISHVAQGFRTLAQTRQSMDQMLSSNRAPCIVWVGVNTSNGLHGGGPGTFGDVRVGGPVINQMIRDAEAASGRPMSRTVYADWAARSTGHPEWFKGPEDVHFTPAGLDAYEQLILDGVAACRSSLTTVADPYPVVDRSGTVPRLDVTSWTQQGYGPSAGYVDITSVRAVYASYGDRLEYDVQYYSRGARIGVDLVTTDGQYLRGTKAADQNGATASPATGLDAWAGGRWYTRVIPLPSSFAGKVVDRFLIGGEADSVNAAGALRRIRIVSSTGALRFTIWDGVTPTVGTYSSSGGTSISVSAPSASRR
jgi:hypothetical protein